MQLQTNHWIGLSVLRYAAQYGAPSARRSDREFDAVSCIDSHAMHGGHARISPRAQTTLGRSLSQMEFYGGRRIGSGPLLVETRLIMSENHTTLDTPPGQRPLRTHTAALVLGILSIVPGICLFYGIGGVIMGTIALVISREDFSAVKAHPTEYNQSQVGTLKAGRVCAIVGLSLSGLLMLVAVMWLILFGTMLASMGSML